MDYMRISIIEPSLVILMILVLICSSVYCFTFKDILLHSNVTYL